MTIWYRVYPHQQPQVVFSGDGGLHVAGRWNHLGHKAIYCSASIALCTLEWLAHNGLSVSAFKYFRYSIDIPDKLVTTISSSDLPAGWSTSPATDLTRDYAEQYLFAPKKKLALAVPSVLVPEEYNLIINSMHTDFQSVSGSIQSLGVYVAPKR